VMYHGSKPPDRRSMEYEIPRSAETPGL